MVSPAGERRARGTLLRSDQSATQIGSTPHGVGSCIALACSTLDVDVQERNADLGLCPLLAFPLEGQILESCTRNTWIFQRHATFSAEPGRFYGLKDRTFAC